MHFFRFRSSHRVCRTKATTNVEGDTLRSTRERHRSPVALFQFCQLVTLRTVVSLCVVRVFLFYSRTMPNASCTSQGRGEPHMQMHSCLPKQHNSSRGTVFSLDSARRGTSYGTGCGRVTTGSPNAERARGRTETIRERVSL